MSTDRFQVRDNGDLHKYRTEIPNMVDDLGLDVYAIRLYLRLKRVAGDTGACWQTTETLAKACCMSTGKIVDAKKALVDAGLIEIDTEKNKSGGREKHCITIVDIWLRNFMTFTSSPGELQAPPSSPHELASSPGELQASPSSPGERPSSPGELKNKPIKKEPSRFKKEPVKELLYEEDPEQIFANMQHSLETLTGRLSTPGDVVTIERLVAEGVIEEDIRSAIAWRAKEKLRPVATIRQLEAGVLRNKAERVQAATAATAKPVGAAGPKIETLAELVKRKKLEEVA